MPGRGGTGMTTGLRRGHSTACGRAGGMNESPRKAAYVARLAAPVTEIRQRYFINCGTGRETVSGILPESEGFLNR